MKVTWSGATGATTRDWIGVFLPSDTNKAHKMFLYTDGKPAGSLEFTLNLAPGAYVFRYLPQDGYQNTATSVAVTLNSSGPPKDDPSPGPTPSEV